MPTPNPTPIPTPTPTPAQPTGGVLPATDSLSGGTPSPANDSWRLILLAMAGILATTLLLTPTVSVAKRRNR